MPSVPLSEEHYRNAFALLRKTLDFLHNEYSLHFILFSCYKSKDRNSVLSLTSPGFAGSYFSESEAGQSVMKSWEEFCKSNDYGSGSDSHPAFQQLSSERLSEDSENDTHDPTISNDVDFSQKRALKRSALMDQQLSAAKKVMHRLKNKSISAAVQRISAQKTSPVAENEYVLDLSAPTSVSEQTTPTDQNNSIICSTPSTIPFFSSLTPNPGRSSNEDPVIVSPSNSDPTDDRKRRLSSSPVHQPMQSQEHIIAKGSWMCPQCYKVIKYKRNARAHLMSHAAVRPCFSCTYCEQSFTTKWNLKKHLKLNHGIDMDVETKFTPGTVRRAPSLATKKFPLDSSLSSSPTQVDLQSSIRNPNIKSEVNSNVISAEALKLIQCKDLGGQLFMNWPENLKNSVNKTDDDDDKKLVMDCAASEHSEPSFDV